MGEEPDDVVGEMLREHFHRELDPHVGRAGRAVTAGAVLAESVLAVVLGSVGAVIAARRGAAAAGRARGSGTLVGAAASACGPNPARPAIASAARIPVWALFKGSVLPRTSAPSRARYPRLFSIDKIDEALTPAQGGTITPDRGRNGAAWNSKVGLSLGR